MVLVILRYAAVKGVNNARWMGLYVWKDELQDNMQHYYLMNTLPFQLGVQICKFLIESIWYRVRGPSCKCIDTDMYDMDIITIPMLFPLNLGFSFIFQEWLGVYSLRIFIYWIETKEQPSTPK